MKIQNKSHAVMAQRHESNFSLDNFPTPPWATRALIEQYLDKKTLATQTCLEPACGAGHMARVLKEYFDAVDSSDVYNYGYGEVRDFTHSIPDQTYNWVITNPPFRLAENFINQATVSGKKLLQDWLGIYYDENIYYGNSSANAFQWSKED